MVAHDVANPQMSQDCVCTPPKTNMEPENDGFKFESTFPGFIFRFHVSFRGCKWFPKKCLVIIEMLRRVAFFKSSFFLPILSKVSKMTTNTHLRENLDFHKGN